MKNKIPNIKLNDELEMPIIGLGTWMLKGKECIKSVMEAIRVGYRHIDTAEVYENEEEIGIAIKNFPRDKLFITSKASPTDATYEEILKKCENSLKRLGTNYLDQYLIHWPSLEINEETLKAFKELYDKKMILSFGVSNYSIEQLKEILKITNKINLPITVNQVEFHPLLYQKELLEFCKKNNIVIVSYSPLARGYVSKNKVLNEIAKKYDKTPAQISLNWLIEKGTIIIPKASSKQHLEENIDFDFKLNIEDIQKIDKVIEEKRLIPL
jgi:diketogulonate reductase-like aldo/keto reductase